jgi:hypothetical protein
MENTLFQSDEENLEQNQMSDLASKWKSEQIELKNKLILSDTDPWQFNQSVYNNNNNNNNNNHDDCIHNETLRYIAGLDISFVKNETTACSGLFVFDITDNMNLVYQDIEIVEMDQPYISGRI